MTVTNDAVGIAAYSLMHQTLELLNKREIITEDDLREILKRAVHPLVASQGGSAMNAEAGKLVGELSRSLLPARTT
jgi:hypothetical protein